MDNYYRIAGLLVQMDSFGRTVEQAEPYRLNEAGIPDIVIESDFDRVKNTFPCLSDSDCEYLSSGASFYRNLLDRYNGMMLHSSAVVVDGKAFLFTADSGTGKSTHTKLWLKLFGDKAFILNDDKPAIRLEDGIWYAYGTPWSGKNDISRNERIPVAGIAVVERAEENQIEPFSGIDAIMMIMRQASKPNNAELRGKMMELVDKLMTQVPVWKLKCNMEPEAAIVAYEAMSGKEWGD